MFTLRRTKYLLVILFCAISLFTIFHRFEEPTQDEFDKIFPELKFSNSALGFPRVHYQHLIELGIVGSSNFVNLTRPLPKLTFVAAISTSHVYEGRAMVMELSLMFLGYKIILYDIGLEPFLRKWFEDACNVEVRDIDLNQYGVGRDLYTYRWKPIVIATALKEFPVILYVDTSTAVRKNATMKEFLSNIPIIEGEPNIYTIGKIDHSVYATTNPGIYKYLPPRINLTATMLEAGKVLYIRTKATYDLGMFFVLWKKNAWHHGTIRESAFLVKKDSKIIYDQSTLNLIMASYPNFNQAEWGMKFFYTQYGQFGSDYWKPMCLS